MPYYSHSSYSKRPKGCSGVNPDWTRCGVEGSGRFCSLHEPQHRWFASDFEIEKWIQHVGSRRCAGINMTGKPIALCRNRKSPFTYCYHHVTQLAPPTWTLPTDSKTSIAMVDHTYQDLRERFLRMIHARLDFEASRRRESEQARSRARAQEGAHDKANSARTRVEAEESARSSHPLSRRAPEYSDMQLIEDFLERFKSHLDLKEWPTAQSISFSSIPWPVLHHHSTMTPSHVTEDAVIAFCKAKAQTREWIRVLKKVRAKYHDDSFKNVRRIPQRVADPRERADVEACQNNVIVALNKFLSPVM